MVGELDSKYKERERAHNVHSDFKLAIFKVIQKTRESKQGCHFSPEKLPVQSKWANGSYGMATLAISQHAKPFLANGRKKKTFVLDLKTPHKSTTHTVIMHELEAGEKMCTFEAKLNSRDAMRCLHLMTTIKFMLDINQPYRIILNLWASSSHGHLTPGIWIQLFRGQS